MYTNISTFYELTTSSKILFSQKPAAVQRSNFTRTPAVKFYDNRRFSILIANKAYFPNVVQAGGSACVLWCMAVCVVNLTTPANVRAENHKHVVSVRGACWVLKLIFQDFKRATMLWSNLVNFVVLIPKKKFFFFQMFKCLA